MVLSLVIWDMPVHQQIGCGAVRSLGIEDMLLQGKRQRARGMVPSL